MATLSVDHIVASEADGYVDVVVRLTGTFAQNVTVDYATADDTAQWYYGDYQRTSGTLTFQAGGETTQTVRVFLTPDSTAEGYESFFFNLSRATNATISNTDNTIGIVDNDTTVTTPGLFVRDVVVDEKAGTASFVVMLGGPNGQASNDVVTVDYATANGSAVAGSDYTATNGTLTFAAGETVKTVTVAITDDSTTEGFERFFLDLKNPSGAAIVDGRGAAVIGASDATAAAQPRISVSDMVVSEADGYVDVVVTLSAPGQNPVSVNYSMSDDTAQWYYGDYQRYSGTLTFATGETTKVVRIEIENDTTTEGLQSFFFNLNTPVNATIAKAFSQISIVDNDTVTDTPNLFVRDVVVDEKAGTANFVVMLGGPNGQSSNSTVTVNYNTVNGTAVAGNDFVGSNGQLVFAAGETVKTVAVDLLDDGAAEGFERFGLNLSGANGANILDGRGDAIIGLSDGVAAAQPRISVSDMVVGESDGYIDVVVSLSAPGQNPVSVNFSMSDDTAQWYYGDYQRYSGTLTFATGETTKVVRIELGDDATAEGLQSFFFNLNTPTNATIAKASAQISIVDDDTVVDTPSLFVRDVVVDEKAGTANFVVMLGGPNGQSSNSTVTVNYNTVNGTAVAGNDFVGSNGQLVFAAGETVKTVAVDLIDDGAAEGFERFGLNLSNATNATIVDGRGEALIGLSDGVAAAQPRISVSDMVVGESDGYIDVVVSLSAPGQNPVTVNYSMSDDTAQWYYGDYQRYSGTLTFATGETTKVVRIELGDDVAAEGFESFFFNLNTPTNATIAKASAQIGVVDDDTVVDTPSLFVRDVVVDEKAGTANFVVMLGGPTGQSANNTVTVNYSTANGTAEAGLDYRGSTGQLVFAAGETVKTVAVDLVDDRLAEGLERFNLNLFGASGATIVDGRAVAEIGASDKPSVAAPSITASDVMVSEADGYVDVVVSLSAPGQVPVSVNFSMSDGSAQWYYADYQRHSGTLNFGVGETTKTVRIEIENDLVAENLENFTFNLSSAIGATIAKPTTSIAIVDDDSGVNVYSHGRSDDVYTVTSATDVVVENPGGGTDLVRSSVNYVLGVNVENLTLTGSAIKGTGNAGNNVITGNARANTLLGLGGNDTLNGGGGADVMTGGAGNDVYIVDNSADVVVELRGGGIDRVESSRSYVLSAEVEHLTLTGTAAINGTGNASNNVILGNGAANVLRGGAGHDTLNGGAGADRMEGGTGNDVYFVDNAGDVIVEALNAGNDTVHVNRSFSLGLNLENLTLTGTGAFRGTGNGGNNVLVGNAAANVLYGLGGNDTLNGGGGADTMVGGAGNDTYYVNHAGDKVVETTTLTSSVDAGGIDKVFSAISYSLASGVSQSFIENLTLTGSAAINATGNAKSNVLIGNAANNTLRGGAGNDTLNGGGGADRMYGGIGNDTYVVNHAGDVVVEALNQGTDTVQSSIHWTLGANLERLQLVGSGTIHGYGNAENNTLIGNAAANLLDGRGGADAMAGGAGNDTYVVNHAGDTVTEALNGGTADTVQSSINYTLGANVERLTLTGTAVSGSGNSLNNVITGNASNNTLRGNAGNDALNGGAGNDVLIGGAGSDRLTGGAGKDVFHFDSRLGSDTITDFRSVDDTFLFSQVGVKIGDGDNVVDGFQVTYGYGGFLANREVTVFTADIYGPINSSNAAGVIYGATTAFSTGTTRLFVVDNGTDSSMFLFRSSDGNQYVSAAELTMLGTFNGTSTVASDYVFSA